MSENILFLLIGITIGMPLNMLMRYLDDRRLEKEEENK